jgi:hypothetical protein
MKNKLLIVALLAVVIFVVIKLVFPVKNKLVSPGIDSIASPLPTAASVPVNNPPKEIKYDSSTDLRQELDSINPMVLDEDFET